MKSKVTCIQGFKERFFFISLPYSTNESNWATYQTGKEGKKICNSA